MESGSANKATLHRLVNEAKAKTATPGPFGIEGVVLSLFRRKRAAPAPHVEAEDVLQDTYLAILEMESRGSLRADTNSLGTIAGTIAGRARAKRIRRPKRMVHQASLEAAEACLANASGPIREMRRKEIREAWKGLVRHLHQSGRRDLLRILIAIREADGNRSDAGRLLGCPYHAVRNGIRDLLDNEHGRKLLRLWHETQEAPL